MGLFWFGYVDPRVSSNHNEVLIRDEWRREQVATLDQPVPTNHNEVLIRD